MSFNEKIASWQATAERLGCVFENVCFKEEPGVGVRVLAQNPDAPCCLKVSDSLLVRKKDLVLTDVSHTVSDQAGLSDEARALVNEMLDTILADEKIAFMRQLMESFAQLPETLRMRLSNLGLAPRLLPEVSLTDAQIKEMLIQARVIDWQGDTTLMVFVDFINHSRDGISYSFDSDGIVVKGQASESGELFALYSAADSFHTLNTYFYPGDSHFAYSIGLGFEYPGLGLIRVGRRYSEVALESGLRVPQVEVKEDGVFISHVWLGSDLTPRKPWWSFNAAWQKQLGRDDALTVYSRIIRFNWLKMHELLALTEGIETLAGKMVRTALLSHIALLAENLIELKR